MSGQRNQKSSLTASGYSVPVGIVASGPEPDRDKVVQVEMLYLGQPQGPVRGLPRASAMRIDPVAKVRHRSVLERGELQLLAKRLQYAVRGVDRACVQSLREPPRPGLLPSSGGLKELLARFCQAHELGAAVMRVVLQDDDALRRELVDDALHALPVQTHGAGEPRDRFCRRHQRNGPEHLPACARQAEVRDEIVSGRNQAAVQPEHFEDQGCQGVRFADGASIVDLAS